MHFAQPQHQMTAIPSQAATDQQLITLWLDDKSTTTKLAYRADSERFLNVTAKPLAAISLADLQAFAESLTGLSDSSRKRILSSVKSLFAFGQRLGYLQYNVAAAIRTPKIKNTLAERILSESEVLTMIALTTKPRDHLIVRLLYSSAARISELCRLRWVDVRPNGDSGQLTLYGKGGQTRVVKLGRETWKVMEAYRADMANHEPLFISQKGGQLSPCQVHRIVKAAARRAGISGNVSAHWLRHSHASHAIDRGASIAVVRDTLGHSSLAITSRYTHARPDQSSSLHLAV